MIYGRFRKLEFDERGDNPFIVQNGRTYRIKEVHLATGWVNYQAEECDPRELEAPLPEAVTVVESAENPQPRVENWPTPSARTHPIPPMRAWVRTHFPEWKGKGFIPQRMVRAYAEEFGLRENTEREEESTPL